MSVISEALDSIAEQILNDLRREDATLAEKLEAFKILSSYDAAVSKTRGKGRASDDDEDRTSFAGFRASVRNAA